MIGQHLGDEIPLLWIRISLDKPDPQQRNLVPKVLTYHVSTHFKALKKFLK